MEAGDGFVGELQPDPPGRLRRQRARIDSVEVASRGQNVCHAARGCASRASRHVPAFERIQEMFDLVPGLLKFRNKFVAGEGEHRGDLRRFKAKYRALHFGDHCGAEAQRLEHRVEVERGAVQDFESIGARVAGLPQQLLRQLEACAGLIEQDGQVEAKGHRQASLQTRCAGVCQPRERAQHLGQGGHLAQNMEASADLGHAQLAQVAV